MHRKSCRRELVVFNHLWNSGGKHFCPISRFEHYIRVKRHSSADPSPKLNNRQCSSIWQDCCCANGYCTTPHDRHCNMTHTLYMYDIELHCYGPTKNFKNFLFCLHKIAKNYAKVFFTYNIVWICSWL